MEQKKREMEIEQLKTENIQSRYDALLTKINPHFLFNSLNSISALVRENDNNKTQKYIHKLSGIFRYILQSDRKGMVNLKEEFDFLDNLCYIMKIRYAEKLGFDISADKNRQENLQIPVLSFLPLIENIVKHNVIDSDNAMTVSIYLNDKNELTVSNPIHEKPKDNNNNGIGIANLFERFLLLTGRKMKVEIDEKNSIFKVILPLS
jgi:LytS/YehU family sensor histidine kinase